MRGKAWRLDHDPTTRPLGCNGRYGTSGATIHRNHSQTACDQCKASAAHYNRERRRGGLTPHKPQPCGTRAAAARHRANQETLCFPCKVAEANYQTGLRLKAKEPQRV